MKLLIVGTGYVGLVTGACFAERGHEVICLDIDNEKIERLLKKETPFFEPGLDELVKRNLQAGRLHFTTDYKKGVAKSEILLLALPTPSRPDGSCNLDPLTSAVDAIAPLLDGYRLIVNKSTVPIGWGERAERRIKEKLSAPCAFDVVSSPEFLKEGSAVHDCFNPDRILIGTKSERAAHLMKELYAPFSLPADRVLILDRPSAEMAKYASNAMLALRISFMNELALLCEKLGANIHKVRRGVGSDSRIGSQFLQAGVGFGGSCFPKDLRSLKMMGDEAGYEMPILTATLAVNARQKRVLMQKIHRFFSSRGGVEGKTLAIWGLSFKPETDDMREAPSLELIQDLLAQGARLRLFDPHAMHTARAALPENSLLTWCKDEYDAARGAHGIALVTEWQQFRSVDFDKIGKDLLEKALFDGRNQYDPEEMKQRGFAYHGIGIPD